jgi:hypothetical protein
MGRLFSLFALLLASLGLYAAVFAWVVDRPLDLGPLRAAISAKRAAAAGTPGPKLIIFAGSNALFSHSCAVIGPMLDLPCVNAGVAMGLGLDYQFALWKPRLHAGDTVYMPLELQQYSMTEAAGRQGPDAAILWRHDRALLLSLGPVRTLSAVFSGTAESGIASLVEMAAAELHPALAHPDFARTDAQGDGIGHDLAQAQANRAFLASLHRPDPTPAAIIAGYGTREVERFHAWATAHGLRVIGGWPTEFSDAPPDPELGPALTRTYGGEFLALRNQGRYRRADFFDSQDHLVSECQALHSIAVARALAPLLGRPARMPSQGATSLASRCP